jgi:hypothetical protein
MANPTVRSIQQLRKNSIQTHSDIADVLRHIIKNVSEILSRNIQSRTLSRNGNFFCFFFKLIFEKASEGQMSDGTSGDTTTFVQMEEIKRAFRALPFVTKLSPVRAHNGHGDGWGVSLRCFSCEEYDSCGKKQESPVQISSSHPTELSCLQELLKRLQDRHGQCVQAVAKAEKWIFLCSCGSGVQGG